MINDIKNNQELKLVIKYLIGKSEYNDDADHLNDLLRRRDSLSNITSDLDYFVSNTLNLNNHEKTKIKNLINSERITRDELSWIEYCNERLCNFLFHILSNRNKLIRLNDGDSDPFDLLSSDLDDEIDTRIFRENLSSNAINHKEKHNAICKHLEEISYDKKTKQFLINKLKDNWTNVVTDTSIINFLNKNDLKQNQWGLDYLSKIKDDDFSFKINYDIDYYNNIVLYFDTCHDIYKKKHLLDKMKKAWSQKKHRDAKDGFKAYSFNMKVSIDKNLSEMSRELNITKNLLVEKLIEKEYKSFKEKLK